jgi:transglutaminase-like putative cysteine protease
MGNIDIYLQPTEFFDFNKKFVREKAFEITAGLETESDKAKALFYWVRDKIKYNMHTYIPSAKANFKASVTLRRKNGFCVSKSVLLSSFARAIGIPARIHLVDLINHKISQKIIDFMETNVMHYHGYSELYLNNKWVKLTPSFDPKTALKGGFTPMVEFDGENDFLLLMKKVIDLENMSKIAEFMRIYLLRRLKLFLMKNILNFLN